MRRLVFYLCVFCIFVGANNAYAQSDRVGYHGMVQGGYSWGIGDNGIDKKELSTIHGYQFSNNLFVGAGLALQRVDLGWEKLTYVPVFANIRYSFKGNKFTPFTSLSCGYNPNENPGMYCNLNVGMRYALTKRLGLNLGVGYEMQGGKASVGYYYPSTNTTVYFSKKNASSIGIKLGIDF